LRVIRYSNKKRIREGRQKKGLKRKLPIPPKKKLRAIKKRVYVRDKVMNQRNVPRNPRVTSFNEKSQTDRRENQTLICGQDIEGPMASLDLTVKLCQRGIVTRPGEEREGRIPLVIRCRKRGFGQNWRGKSLERERRWLGS